MHCTAYGLQATHRQNSRKRRQRSITPTLYITDSDYNSRR